MNNTIEKVQQLQNEWKTNPRWAGVKRTYTAEEVIKLRGSYTIEYSIARRGAEILWHKLNTQKLVSSCRC